MSSRTGFHPAIEAKVKAPRNTYTYAAGAQKKIRRARRKVQISLNNLTAMSAMLKEYGIFFRKILQIINTDDDFCSSP